MKKFVVILIVGFLSSGIISNHDSNQHIYFLKSKLFNWAGKIHVSSLDTARMTTGQLNQLKDSIQPGDFFLTRKSYYLSNLAIPGFWTHACPYIGNPAERSIFFSGDTDCIDWIKSMGEKSGSLEKLLQKDFNSKYLKHTDVQLSRPIVEAINEGVVFSSFSKISTKDRVVVLRPQVTKVEVAKAIYHSFKMAGRPYDYNFDFSTDTAIACSELIHKIYKESKLFAVNQLFGNPFSTPNEIAMHYDDKFHSKNLRLKMIFLFDGNGVYDSKNISGNKIFRKSCKTSFL